jgi:excisionase family DNA binding protein
MEPEPFIDSEQAAAYLSADIRFVREMCRTGSLPHIRIGGRGQIRTKASWLDRWGAGEAVDVQAEMRNARPMPASADETSEATSMTAASQTAMIATVLRALGRALRLAADEIERVNR